MEPIIIVGGGIGGLSAALALEHAGIDVEVYEQAPELEEVGAGLGLWPNAVAAFDDFGIGNRIRALAGPEVEGAARTPQGKKLMSFPAEVLNRRYAAPMVGVHRADLQMALAEVYGVGRIHTGHRFISFEQSEDDVLVQFDNGATATGSALVGADGLWSRVRMQLLGDGRPRYRGDTAWRAIIPTPPDLTGFTESFETIGRGKRFGAMPIRGNRLLWFSGDCGPRARPTVPTFGANSWSSSVTGTIPYLASSMRPTPTFFATTSTTGR